MRNNGVTIAQFVLATVRAAGTSNKPLLDTVCAYVPDNLFDEVHNELQECSGLVLQRSDVDNDMVLVVGTDDEDHLRYWAPGMDAAQLEVYATLREDGFPIQRARETAAALLCAA